MKNKRKVYTAKLKENLDRANESASEFDSKAIAAMRKNRHVAQRYGKAMGFYYETIYAFEMASADPLRSKKGSK